jgi:hypothetical protein
MTAEATVLEGRALFLFCALCPTPCRRAMPADDAAQLESCTPSSLSMIALAVIDGHLDLDAGTRAALARTGPARACRAACPYGYDIAGAIDAFVAGACDSAVAATRVTGDAPGAPNAGGGHG